MPTDAPRRALATLLLLACACGGSSPKKGSDAGVHDASSVGDSGPALPGSGSYFPSGTFYFDDVSAVAPVTNSAAITANMESTIPPYGWGGYGATRGYMSIDFSIVVVEAPTGTMKYAYTNSPGYYYAGECDTAPIPLPPGGSVETNWQTPQDWSTALSAYACIGFDSGDDCHLLVSSPSEHRLYEAYHATRRADGSFEVGCLALWDTSSVPGPDGRGLRCTSADAAGYAIAPLLVTPQEVMSGEIPHAIRLILPNELIRGGVFFRPATHGTNSTGGADTIPYGGRMRLRADYPLDSLSPAAQVVARAMQKHGMLLADGGQIAITMASDVLSPLKWSDVGLAADSLAALRATDFDVLVEGSAIATSGADCPHVPITQ